ncbi:hypothetical protein RHCRD62_40164 [Rhodococcus sp. RD6.2]|nr:hypothetical protein RHCRD62_40164 [Rhodococcus sp. RD6.2]
MMAPRTSSSVELPPTRLARSAMPVATTASRTTAARTSGQRRRPRGAGSGIRVGVGATPGGGGVPGPTRVGVARAACGMATVGASDGAAGGGGTAAGDDGVASDSLLSTASSLRGCRGIVGDARRAQWTNDLLR